MRNRALWTLCALLAVNAVLLAAQPGYALPQSFHTYLLGPKMLRAEVIVMDGGIRDYRLDRGRIHRITGTTLVVHERDRTIVSVPVATTARITLNGRTVSFSALRRGMNVMTVRQGDLPAETVTATR
jgi:hypothetical protein